MTIDNATLPASLFLVSADIRLYGEGETYHLHLFPSKGEAEYYLTHMRDLFSRMMTMRAMAESLAPDYFGSKEEADSAITALLKKADYPFDHEKRFPAGMFWRMGEEVGATWAISEVPLSPNYCQALNNR